MLLDNIDSPKDLKKIKICRLPELANEIREEIIDVVSENGGHLSSNLGVVELAIALHYVFDSPKDKIIWDTGHQSYAHKLLTGRKNQFHAIRRHNGITGFTNIRESEHDIFGAGHASTSISAALGVAKARDLKRENYHVISVIGDGAVTGGLAFEGLNNAGQSKTDMIVILNDNKMSISKSVGALSNYMTRMILSPKYNKLRKKVKKLLDEIPIFKEPTMKTIAAIRQSVKSFIGGDGFFEHLGFRYIGPIDGHNIEELVNVLNKIKVIKGPVLLHVLTTKGKGYEVAEKDAIKFHGIGSFDKLSGQKNSSEKTSYSDVFSDTLVKLAEKDERIVAITAAMAEGTKLKKFSKKFPKRFFDVGIAEGHAITFAAGLARNGLKPVAVIYSTFLQRAYDNIIHDVCLQNLPVVFGVDRAGLVGDDGPTHHGCFDLSYLGAIPNMVVMAPKDENELQHMLKSALDYNKPVAIRYPRGSIIGVKLDKKLKKMPFGKSEYLKKGKDGVIVAIGSMVYPSLEAAKILEEKYGKKPGVINARFVKPLDKKIIDRICEVGKAVIVEENSLKGGFGSAVLEELKKRNCHSRVELMGIPDRFIEHGNVEELKEECGLTARGIVSNFMKLV